MFMEVLELHIWPDTAIVLEGQKLIRSLFPVSEGPASLGNHRPSTPASPLYLVQVLRTRAITVGITGELLHHCRATGIEPLHLHLGTTTTQLQHNPIQGRNRA